MPSAKSRACVRSRDSFTSRRKEQRVKDVSSATCKCQEVRCELMTAPLPLSLRGLFVR